MANIENIVDINITRQTEGVSRTGFGVPLVISTFVNTDPNPQRVKTYTSAQEVLNDFTETDNEYIIAQRVFGQEIGPNFLKIATAIDQGADPAETIVDIATAAAAADNDWYFMLCTSHDATNIIDLAGWVETERKMFFTAYDGADGLDDQDTNDPGSQLNASENDRTVIVYANDASDFPEAAWVGLQAPKNPGSTTWKFKGVSGAAFSSFTPTELLTLKGTKYDVGKGYNVYTRVAGRNMFSEGNAVGGEFIDVIRFSDWLEVRMRERIFLTMINSEKIPQTRAGYTVIEGRMREVLTEGVRRGGLQNFEISVPDPNNADPNDLANRVATGFSFRARLAGAIHFVEITGTLTVEEL